MSQHQAIQDKDYPNMFQAADSASKTAQSNYIKLIALDLILMIIASLLAIYNYSSICSKQFIYIISAVLLAFALISTIIVLTKKFEDIWYQGRALAESCKTLTWRFMTCSELFEHTLSEDQAIDNFVLRIKELSEEFTDLNKNMNAKLVNKPIVTQLMKDIRKLDLVKRKEYYIINRIESQKDWYSNKAEFNKVRYNWWFGIIIASQAMSLISIFILISHPEMNWNLVGLFTTLASCAISWLQLKQHQELKQAYTTAAQELNFIVALSHNITGDQHMAKFVLDSENAVSREHTLWLAQKRTS